MCAKFYRYFQIVFENTSIDFKELWTMIGIVKLCISYAAAHTFGEICHISKITVYLICYLSIFDHISK